VRAAVYTRVSTDEQADEGLSLRVQAERGRAAALERGADALQIYEDDGWSGTCFERPALQRMLADLDDLDLVVVWKLDRLSRSVRDWANMMDMFAEHDCGLISVTEQFDMTTAMGRAMMGMMAVWAELFVDILRENVRAALQHRVESGLHHGIPPYGYRSENGELVVVPEEAAIVRRMFEYYVSGDNLRQLEHRAQRENWPPPPRAARWNRTSIRNMLRNPAYVGLIRYNGETHDGVHEPLISPKLWRRANQRLKARRGRHGPQPQSLAGLYRCGICGGYMARVRSGPEGRYYRYVCGERLTLPAERRHEPVGVAVYAGDTVVRIWARELLTVVLPEAVEKAIADNASGQASELERIDCELARIEEQLCFYHEAVANGTLPTDMLSRLAGPLVARRNELRRDREETMADVPQLPEWATDLNAEGIDYLFRQTTCEQQVEMLSQLFEVEVHPGRRLVFKHRAPLRDAHIVVPSHVRIGDTQRLEKVVGQARDEYTVGV